MKWIFSLFILMLPKITHAHVGYVLNDAEFTQNSGADFGFLIGAISSPVMWFYIICSLGLGAVMYLILRKSEFFNYKKNRILEKEKEYVKFFPGMIRLALGISLIGAGASDVFLNPAFEASLFVSSLEIGLGFLILVGFLIVPTVYCIILLFLFLLTQDLYVIGNLDFLALALAMLMYGNSRPGIDDLLEIPFASPFVKWRKYVPLVLRIGVGVAMIYLALYEKILNPHTAAMVVEDFNLNSFIPVGVDAWVLGAGVIEFVIGLCMILGYRVRLVSMIAFMVLTASFFYFGEDVYSHITLFAVLSILFVTGKNDHAR
jgi:uncharacterized membrane protein YphA (DoxX/SURF4 family)